MHLFGPRSLLAHPCAILPLAGKSGVIDALAGLFELSALLCTCMRTLSMTV